MNLHKLLFPSKHKEIEKRIWDLDAVRKLARQDEQTITSLEKSVTGLKAEVKKLKDQTPEMLENIMRASLGLPYLRFDNVKADAKGNDNPPHYLDGLDSEARKGFVSYLASVYRDERFKSVMDWFVNVLGNHSIQKAPKETMENGRLGIIAFRGFRKEFENANAEYQDSLKDGDEDFDKHAPLPEL